MIVVFDTNAYRDLVSGVDVSDVEHVIGKVLQLESEKGITAMMCSITAEEILGHLLDDEDTRTYKSCIKATKAMYMHCGNEQDFRLVPSPQTQIAKEYYHVRSKKFEDTQIALGHLAFRISEELTKANVEANRTQLEKVKRHLQESEAELANGVLQMGKKIDPAYTDWNLFVGNQSMRDKYLNYVRSINFRQEIALGMLCAVAINLETERLITTDDVKGKVPDMVTAYLKSYEAALNMQQLFFEHVLEPGFDITQNSHANYLWDTQILHFVGHSVNNEEILLVTSDKAMIRMANKALADKAMSLNEYKTFIGLV